MHEGDLGRVPDIAAVCYPEHYEEPAIYAERLRLFPEGCFALQAGAEVQGYILSHPWIADSAPLLDTLLHRLPEHPTACYLHDLALMPAVRGQGLARPGIERVRAAAAGLPLTLVSVNRTVAFWERMGFDVHATKDLEAKLESYGPDARFMVARPGG